LKHDNKKHKELCINDLGMGVADSNYCGQQFTQNWEIALEASEL
jgi:hypothetical protein